MFELKDIVTVGQKPKPPRVLVFGTDKVGKNTWCAGAPSPIVIQAEEGSNEIGTPRFPLCTRFDEIMTQVEMLATQQHDYQTVILDSADFIERLVWDQLCRTENVTTIEKVGGGFGKGFTASLGPWRELLQGLTYLRNEKNMGIIFIAHHEVKTVALPDVESHDRYQPKLNKQVMGLLKEWTDSILFAGYQVYTKDAGNGKKQGVGTGERVLRCTERPQWLAGNRYDLPDSLPMPKVGGYQIFQDHVTKFFTNGNQTATKQKEQANV